MHPHTIYPSTLHVSYHITPPTVEPRRFTCSPHIANLGDFHNEAQHFLIEELASATRTTYAVGKQKYIHFCTIAKIPPTPATESTLLLFTSHLVTVNIFHATIKVYLSAIHHMHVLAGLHEHFSKQLTPRLQLVLRGIKKTQSLTSPPRVHLLITLQIMQHIKSLNDHTHTGISCFGPHAAWHSSGY